MTLPKLRTCRRSQSDLTLVPPLNHHSLGPVPSLDKRVEFHRFSAVSPLSLMLSHKKDFIPSVIGQDFLLLGIGQFHGGEGQSMAIIVGTAMSSKGVWLQNTGGIFFLQTHGSV